MDGPPTITSNALGGYRVPGMLLPHHGDVEAHSEPQSLNIIESALSRIGLINAAAVDDIPVTIPGLEKPIYISQEDHHIISTGQHHIQAGKKEPVQFTVHLNGKDYPMPELPPLKKD